MAQSFLTSTEYQSHYANLTNDQFITDLYQNALGRAPEQQGLAGYEAELNGGASRATVAVQIAESTESQRYNIGKIETGFHLA